jgi:hypothetical protein
MEFTDRNGIPIADDDENDDNPGDDLTEADTAGVNYPDLDNTDNPPGLLIEPEEIDDGAAVYDQGHDDKATMTFLSYPMSSQITAATTKGMISQEWIPRTPMGTRSHEWTPRRSREWTKMMMHIQTPTMAHPLLALTSTAVTMKTTTMKRRSPRTRATHPR